MHDNLAQSPEAVQNHDQVRDASGAINSPGPTDGATIAGFGQKLPTHDLLFGRRDVSHPKVVTARLDALAKGFRAEAVLHDHVNHRDGTTYGLAVLCHHLAAVQSRVKAYGVADALGG